MKAYTIPSRNSGKIYHTRVECDRVTTKRAEVRERPLEVLVAWGWRQCRVCARPKGERRGGIVARNKRMMEGSW